MTKALYQRLAAYNRWANRRLYDVVATVPEARYHQDCGAFFRSLHGTLNHLMVGDRIWLARFEGRAETIASLDTILHESFAELSAARAALDDRIIAFADGLDERRLGQPLAYRSMAGTAHELPLGDLLTHAFNHGTHHRGQAHTLLTQFGYAAPALDYVYFLLNPAP